MYAIIEAGGKQFKVEKGDKIRVEKINASIGDKVEFQVLLTAEGKTVKVGNPYVKGTVVEAKVLEQDKEKKVIVFHYKPKKDYRKKQGHRQPYTLVEILSIGEAKETESKPAAKAAAEKAPAESKPAAKKAAAPKAAAESKPAAKKATAAKKPAAKKAEEKAE